MNTENDKYHFSVVLNSSSVYATNTALKDFTWAFDFGIVEPGDYEMGFTIQTGNATGITNQTSSLPLILNVDIGTAPQNYIAGSTVARRNSYNLGYLTVQWTSTTVATFNASSVNNHPIIVRNLHTAGSFIRASLLQASGAITATGASNWFLVLNFRKI